MSWIWGKKDQAGGASKGTATTEPLSSSPPVAQPEQAAATTTAAESKCPVSPAARKLWGSWGRPKDHPKAALNPDNNMPAEAAQAAAPGQAVQLDKTRVKSTIPKGDGTEENWEYPSPQMVMGRGVSV
jgi:hypothetical protein